MKKKITLKKVAAIIGILTGIAGIYIPVAIDYHFFPFQAQDIVEKTPKITIQEAFVDDAAGKYPVLDISILNEGNQTAVLTQAHFTVEKLWKLNPSHYLSYRNLQPTANYEVKLRLDEDNLYDDHIRISHSIEESKADRFTFTLQHQAPLDQQYVVQMEVALLYNGKQSAITPDLIFIASNPGFISKYSSSSQELLSKVTEIKNAEGKKSLGVEELISEILYTSN